MAGAAAGVTIPPGLGGQSFTGDGQIGPIMVDGVHLAAVEALVGAGVALEIAGAVAENRRGSSGDRRGGNGGNRDGAGGNPIGGVDDSIHLGNH